MKLKMLALATVTLLLLGCKSSNTTLDDEVRKLFFNVNTKSSYDDMVKYFKSQKSLMYIKENGYTEYPPRSDSGNKEIKHSSDYFEINTYDDIKGIKKGALFLMRVGPHDDNITSLQMLLGFQNKTQADNAFNGFMERLKGFSIVKEDLPPFTQRRTIHDQRNSSTNLEVLMFVDDSLKLYNVQLHTVIDALK